MSSYSTASGLGSRIGLTCPKVVAKYQSAISATRNSAWTARLGQRAAVALGAPAHGVLAAAGALAHRRLRHRLADFLVQQRIELVADAGELFRGDEVGLARMRLVDLDDLLDGAGAGREHRHPVGQEHRLAEAVGHEHDGLVGARQQHREILAQHHAGLLVERAERLVHQQDVGLQAQARAPARRAGACRRTAGPDSTRRNRRARRPRATCLARFSRSALRTPWNIMPSFTFSITVLHGNSAFSWNTKAISCGIGPRTGWLPTSTVPDGRLHQAADDVEQRALAAAARPDQAQQLAAPDIERGVEQRPHIAGAALLAERLGHAPNPNRHLVRHVIAVLPRRFVFLVPCYSFLGRNASV